MHTRPVAPGAQNSEWRRNNEEGGVSAASASREVKHQTVYKASFLSPAAH